VNLMKSCSLVYNADGNGFRVGGRIVVVAATALALSACSYVPDWANPVNLYDEVFDGQNSLRQLLPWEKDTGEFPTLASVPDDFTETTSSDEAQQIREGLIADRESARYTDEELRSGPAEELQDTHASSAEVLSSPSEDALDDYEVKEIAVTTDIKVRPLIEEVDPTEPSVIGEAESLYEEIEPLASSSPVVEESLVSDTSFDQPLLEPDPRNEVVPTVDDTVTVVVASTGQDILAQTFSKRLSESGATVTTAPANPSFSDLENDNVWIDDADAPVDMELSEGAASGPSYGNASSVAAIIKFKNGSAHISASYRGVLREMASAYGKHGGLVKVVGHASSRTRNLDLADHMMANFSISIDRAEAVARELIQLGVPGENIVAEAKSDGQPLYYEVMPSGEDENRRVEIFLEY